MLELQTGHFPTPVFDDLALVGINEAASALQSGAVTLCDIRSSVAYRQSHIPGAGFLTRAQIELDAGQLPAGGAIILMADDQAYGELISRDLKRLGHTVRLLDADLPTWIAAGHPLETGLARLFSRPSERHYHHQITRPIADPRLTISCWLVCKRPSCPTPCRQTVGH